MLSLKLAPGTNPPPPPPLLPPLSHVYCVCVCTCMHECVHSIHFAFRGAEGRSVLSRRYRWDWGLGAEEKKGVCRGGNNRCEWRVWCVINNTLAPSPNLLKLPAHTVGPLPAPRCEHNRSNTPEIQSAHPLSNAHTSLLWWPGVHVEERGCMLILSCESEG